MTDFASGLDVGGAIDQFGRKLTYDFVQNNQGGFGPYGWMADQLAPYAEGYDGSVPNGQLAGALAAGATLATPGGAGKRIAAKTAGHLTEDAAKLSKQLGSWEGVGELLGQDHKHCTGSPADARVSQCGDGRGRRT